MNNFKNKPLLATRYNDFLTGMFSQDLYKGLEEWAIQTGVEIPSKRHINKYIVSLKKEYGLETIHGHDKAHGRVILKNVLILNPSFFYYEKELIVNPKKKDQYRLKKKNAQLQFHLLSILLFRLQMFDTNLDCSLLVKNIFEEEVNALFGTNDISAMETLEILAVKLYLKYVGYLGLKAYEKED